MSQEPWLRGPVDGVIDELQPVAHALLFAREELERLLPGLSCEQVWKQAGGAAPIGWHVRHSMGSLQRMLTYARGEALSEEQLAMIKTERDAVPELDGRMLLDISILHLDMALQRVRDTSAGEANEVRYVGRKQLPSTVRGLLFEIAVHTARHVGQIATTAKVVG